MPDPHITPPELAAALLAASDQLLLAVDPATQTIIAANPHACAVLGYTPETLIGRPITEVEAALPDVFFWNEVAAGSLTDQHNVESLYACADGRLLPVHKNIRVIDTGSGRVLAIRAVDREDRERTESDLAQTGALLAATLESTAEGILVVNLDGSIENFNRRFAAIWPVPESLLASRNDRAIYRYLRRQIDHPATGGPGLLRMLGGRQAELQTTFTLRDGRTFECRSRPREFQGRILGRVISFSDISERIAHERELAAARDEAWRATQAKSEFLATMSHEIRTPMNGVIGMAELLIASGLEGEPLHHAETIRSSGELLLGIINDILDVSKIEAGKLELESLDFDFPAALAEVHDLLAFRAREKGLDFSVRIDPAMPRWLRGDPLRLRQILLNLCSNAIKFTDRGRVTVHCDIIEQDAHSVGLRIAVRDSGIGIAAASLKGLFAPFVQADTTTTRRFGGTGLGLSICKRLVEMMGGVIGADSVEGQGSTFWCELDLPIGRPPAAVAAVALPQGDAAVVALDVLVVDDNTVNRQVLKAMLDRGGHRVDFAEDGIAALEALRTKPYALILMDCLMPEMDGYTATRHLRAGEAGEQNRRTRVVACTAATQADAGPQCLAAGMDELLQKPVHWNALAGVLARCADTLADPAAARAAPAQQRVALFDAQRLIQDMGGDVEIARLVVDSVLESIPLHLRALRQALDERNGEVIHRLAHSIKGVAAQVGAQVLSDTARRIERLAQSAQFDAIEALQQPLCAAWDALQGELSDWRRH
jgi:PAS domain S-box-containing protein